MADRKHTRPTEKYRAPHVCLVVHARYPIGEPRAERAARAAHNAGYRVSVIALRGEDEKSREVVGGIRVHRLPIGHSRGATIARIVYEYLGFTLLASFAVLGLYLRSRIDVVQIHSPPDFLVVAGLLPRLLGSRLVLDNRDLSPHMWGVRFSGKSSAKMMEKALVSLERAACALADRVMTVHEPYRNELAAHGVPREKVTIVMNTPDEALIARVRNQTPAAEPEYFTVAYHGTITWWYGVDLLVEAIAHASSTVPNIRGLVLGEGDGLPRVHQLADGLGVSELITVSGQYRPLEETLRAVAHADCGVIPNRPSELNRFALGNKLFEYVALRVPVVVADLPTLRAHFDASEVTFFSAGESESLAEAIQWVAENPDEAHAKAARAAERASDYSWSKNSARYLTVIED